jgi:hypothetical protein
MEIQLPMEAQGRGLVVPRYGCRRSGAVLGGTRAFYSITERLCNSRSEQKAKKVRPQNKAQSRPAVIR